MLKVQAEEVLVYETVLINMFENRSHTGQILIAFYVIVIKFSNKYDVCVDI